MAPQFIEGPGIGPGSFTQPPVTPGGAKEVFYDSSAARAAYYEQQGMGGAGEAGVEPPPAPAEPWQQPPVANENLDAALLRAAANGSPLTPDLIGRLPSAGEFPAFRAPAVGRVAARAPYIDDTTGLTVRVGKGIVASVSFSGGEPTRKHWARLLRFIEIAAEELDEDEPETPPRSGRGVTAVVGSEEVGAGERGLPRAAEPRKRKSQRKDAESGELGGDSDGGRATAE